MANEQKYQYPSRFGSHASMVSKDNGDGTVVCSDEFGEYNTLKNRVDSGLADPNRYKTARMEKLFAGKSEKPEEKR